nr:zinc knuckle CX2CX4HX4C [Tanacetum cinerariifolium]
MNTLKDGFDIIYGKTSNGGTMPVSFASIFMDNTHKKMVQLSELSNEESVEGADVAIPLEAVDKVSNPFVNTLHWLHNLPIVAYSKVGLSLLTTKLGQPIMLNAYTRTMCLKSWGRTTYARALIKVSSKKEDNGNPMDDFVDETRKKVEVHPKKTPKKTGIWSGRKADSPKRNVVFSPKTKVNYFDSDAMEFNDMGQAAKGWDHENSYNDKG